jgi:hypothetical protein
MIVDKANATNFELIIGKIPNKTVSQTKNVILNLFETVIPSMDVTTIDANWMGVVARRDNSGGVSFQDWTVSFFVDRNFDNWRTLHDWLKYAAEQHTIPSEHNVGATLSIRNNFNEEVIRIFFENVWIKNIGEVRLTYQSGEEFLQCTATFEYSRFDVYGSTEEIS